MRAALLAGLLAGAAAPALAGTLYLPKGGLVWFDFTTGTLACPINMTPAPTALNGYILIGDPDSTGAGSNATNGHPPLAPGQDATHSHYGSSSICTSPASMPTGTTGAASTCTPTPGPGNDWAIRKQMCSNATTAGATSSAGSGYPLVSLAACMVTVDNYWTVHQGTIVYMAPGYSCPLNTDGNWQVLASGLGRTIVALDPALSYPSSGSSSPLDANGDYSILGGGSTLTKTQTFSSAFNHTHVFTSQATLSGLANPGTGSGTTVIPMSSSAVNVTVNGTVTAGSNNLPLKKLALCEPATGNGIDTAGNVLPSGALVFYNRQLGCPTTGGNWLQVSEYMGKLIVVAESFGQSGVLFGSNDTLAQVTQTGGAPSHTHDSLSGGSVDQGSTCGVDYAQNAFSTPGPSFVLGRNGGRASFPIVTASTAASTGDAIPYAGFVMCRQTITFYPTKSPVTKAPTNSPVTQTPTSSPTRAPSSSRPTYSPSKSGPTRSPSKSSPSKSPSSAPISQRPSVSPVTSSPTHSPSSARPTRSPSRSPITRAPTATPILSAPTASPTTSRPTWAPSTVKPTFAPWTTTPSKSPTTSRPSRSPSRSPTWTKPSAAPHSRSPTTSPSSAPFSSAPTKAPSTRRPSKSPTLLPSASPTAKPTKQPHHGPSASPLSTSPSAAPSHSPTSKPTTARPTWSPSSAPVKAQPSASPSSSSPTSSGPSSSAPSTGSPVTSSPSTSSPSSHFPTPRPTHQPHTGPSQSPQSSSPTYSPSVVPTLSPVTSSPTTASPSSARPTSSSPSSAAPTSSAPSQMPTSGSPTLSTSTPSHLPTSSQTSVPTASPSNHSALGGVGAPTTPISQGSSGNVGVAVGATLAGLFAVAFIVVIIRKRLRNPEKWFELASPRLGYNNNNKGAMDGSAGLGGRLFLRRSSIETPVGGYMQSSSAAFGSSSFPGDSDPPPGITRRFFDSVNSLRASLARTSETRSQALWRFLNTPNAPIPPPPGMARTVPGNRISKKTQEWAVAAPSTSDEASNPMYGNPVAAQMREAAMSLSSESGEGLSSWVAHNI